MESDFLDVPKLTLTLPQAQQRFGVGEVTCEAVLGALVEAGVLGARPSNRCDGHIPSCCAPTLSAGAAMADLGGGDA
jgi:hypothetical protein